jgi:hypothetical protein
MLDLLSQSKPYIVYSRRYLCTAGCTNGTTDCTNRTGIHTARYSWLSTVSQVGYRCPRRLSNENHRSSGTDLLKEQEVTAKHYMIDNSLHHTCALKSGKICCSSAEAKHHVMCTEVGSGIFFLLGQQQKLLSSAKVKVLGFKRVDLA